MKSEWIVQKNGFDRSDVELHGSKFLTGNGYMGYRGTMEEYGADKLVAINIAGLFDKNGDLWRESVNAPNPLFTTVCYENNVLSAADTPIKSHLQTLDIKHAYHTRKTVFYIDDTEITVEAERFISMTHEHIMALKYSVCANKDITITLKTGIDKNIWDINGPHLENSVISANGENSVFKAVTVQNKIPLSVFEKTFGIDGFETDSDDLHTAELKLIKGEKTEFTKVAGVYWGDAVNTAETDFADAVNSGFENLKAEHICRWEEIWDNCDVVIEGDKEAQLALRYSIYHLNIIAPKNTDKCGIPARGLSGQVYKGAAFWDTEMFMLPFFCFTNPQVANNLVKYRVNTLEGAKRKAEEFGFEGAFFAWESQETGDDACTLFNVTDIFTNRPLRTYFKDKQIHVSADMVYAMWYYCSTTLDFEVLRDGGLELMYQCLWFYYTYSSFRKHKDRYEFLDVVGPDEYHERVDNNAFTNSMISHAAKIFVKALAKVKELYPESYEEFKDKNDLYWLYEFADKIYLPKPDKNEVIEQFDGYMKLEDVFVSDVKKRELKPNEYWGGHGIASTTRVLKQADIIMMLSVYKNEYSESVKRANWEFYEPYTEHGSSLSACAYAIVAADIGYTDWAYKYFMKTACIDLSGDSKQYLGSLYIGGTHPAANGGSWNTAIFGFAGVSYTDDVLDISPSLPSNWKSLSFKLIWHGAKLNITIKDNNVEIKSCDNIENLKITVNGKNYK